MCRYGMSLYETHYVCVPCRRTSKINPYVQDDDGMLMGQLVLAL